MDPTRQEEAQPAAIPFLQPRARMASPSADQDLPPTASSTLSPPIVSTVPNPATETNLSSPSPEQISNDPAIGRSRSPVVPEKGTGVWKLKDIGLWPDVRAGGMFRRDVRILIQNANGPCSLLALANCLLLRGSIHIPRKHNSITYDQLSLLIADFLVTRPNDNSTLTLESALSILPTMTQGLDVDVDFSGIDKFKGISARESGELSVFDFAGVELVHGWLADPGMVEEYEALMRAGSYEGAQERIVGGLEAETKAISLKEGGASGLSEEEHEMIEDSQHLQAFLQSSSSQLTYPGLFALSALEPGSVVAFFRNSHLSVLYRRYNAGSTSDDTSGEPVLFQLVTDSAFRNEPEITWESIVDVDGSGSGFFSSEFRPAGAAGGDFAGLDAAHALSNAPQPVRVVDDSADSQLAAALQGEEDERTAREHDRAERQRSVRMDPNAQRRAKPDESKQKEKKDKKDKKDCLIM